MRILTLFAVISLAFSCCFAAENAKTNAVYMANGIKIGEVDSTSAIVWTRLTKRPERNINGVPFPERKDPWDKENQGEYVYDLEVMDAAVPGAPGQVRLTYWPEGVKAQPKVTDWMPVDPDKDFTLQTKLTGLFPGTRYSIIAEGAAAKDSKDVYKVQGGFKTAPETADISKTRFVVVTCQEYPRRDDEMNGHKIYDTMLKMDPDFFVHTGDIEYYDKPFPFADDVPLARFKWNRIFSMPFQRNFHNHVTSYFIKDDHDTLRNDCWAGQTYGRKLTFDEGLAIFREQVPMGEKTYRTIRWGKDLQVWLVEGRDFRSPNNMPDGPDKTIWGKEQKEWFFDTVKKSDATFRILISPTPVVGPDRPSKKDNLSNSNFQFEGSQIRQFISTQKNMFVICGDRHWQYASVDPKTGVKEYGTGPSSDEHANGYSEKNRTPMHTYLKVKGGCLSVTVERVDGQPRIIFKHHAVDGSVRNEDINEVK